jgi:hypothetical protein
MEALVLAAIFLVALVLQHFRDQRHNWQIEQILARQDAERYAWARERWELNTRVQSPEVMRVAPVAPPQAPAPDGAPLTGAELDEEDEIDLVGRIVGRDED